MLARSLDPEFIGKTLYLYKLNASISCSFNRLCNVVVAEAAAVRMSREDIGSFKKSVLETKAPREVWLLVCCIVSIKL